MRSSLAHARSSKNHIFTNSLQITTSTMAPRIQVSNKRKSTSTTSATDETPRILDEDFSDSTEEEEVSHAASRASFQARGRPATSASTILARVMGANLKSLPPAALATPTRAAASSASQASSSRARAVQSPPVQAARATYSTLASQNVAIENHVSPPAVAQMPVASPQAMHPPMPIQDAGQRQSPPAHFVAAIPTQDDQLDDASSLSATENGNNKAMRMLHQYFMSLAASGTVRSIVEEKDLITDKLGIIFKKIKFINADTDLCFEGNIARVLYKEMKIPENYRAIWWEQMKIHVRKKMDERRSNCGASIKKSILSK